MARKSDISTFVAKRIPGMMGANNLTVWQIARQCSVNIGTMSNITGRTTTVTIEPQ